MVSLSFSFSKVMIHTCPQDDNQLKVLREVDTYRKTISCKCSRKWVRRAVEEEHGSIISDRRSCDAMAGKSKDDPYPYSQHHVLEPPTIGGRFRFISVPCTVR